MWVGVQPHGDDEFVFSVGGQRAFFKKPHTHDLGVGEVSRLRKFLKDAGRGAPTQEPAQPETFHLLATLLTGS
jgi:hypothetical protein